MPLGGTVLFTFDDTFVTHYTEAFPYLAAKGWRGTCFVASFRIGVSGRLTSAQMQEMYAAGWDFGNHFDQHQAVINDNMTQAQIETAITNCKNALNGYGWTRASGRVAYPGGQCNDISDAAMQALGLDRGWTSAVGITTSASNPLHMNRNFLETMGLEAVKTQIILARKARAICTVAFHDLVGANLADFKAIVDWVAQEQNLSVLTVSEIFGMQA